jgi:hypothetical protein
MPERPSLPIIAARLAGCFSLLLLACQSPGATRIVGPDGSPMAHVHCGADQGTCFRIAGQLCPTGYDLTPVLSGNDGNFLVSCRATRLPTVAARCPSPATTRTPPQAWPPGSEPPLMYPWPPPEASTAVRASPKASTTPQGDVDIGY